MTLNLSPEEKLAREKQYKKEYSRQYYREQKALNNERYKDILEKAKERYSKKMAENDNNNGGKRQYKKSNFFEKKNE